MNKNKAFFDNIANHILNECDSENDFIKAYKDIKEYCRDNDVKETDKAFYIESGASEFLLMNTIDYREEQEDEDE